MFVLTIKKFFSKTKVTKFVTIFVTRDFTVYLLIAWSIMNDTHKHDEGLLHNHVDSVNPIDDLILQINYTNNWIHTNRTF